MNFKKLQAMQLELDNSILSAKPQMTAEERFNKTLVALSVEVAEAANCAEHFKFWKDNKGKVDRDKFYCIPQTQREGVTKPERWCHWDNQAKIITREQAHKLTLVEEASDCLHFILSLANQLGIDLEIDLEQSEIADAKINQGYSYSFIQYNISLMGILPSRESRIEGLYTTVKNFYIYIFMLGITTKELEQAYYKKNEVNYTRLREGY